MSIETIFVVSGILTTLYATFGYDMHAVPPLLDPPEEIVLAPAPCDAWSSHFLVGLETGYVRQHDEGWILGALGGWQAKYHKIVLGIEANVDLQRVHTDNYEHDAIWAFTGRAGYALSPVWMPYVRLGFQLSNDEIHYQILDTDVSRQKTVLGAVAGIGAEFSGFFDCSTLRLEYVFSQNSKIKIENQRFDPPQTHAIKLAWVWNYC